MTIKKAIIKTIATCLALSNIASGCPAYAVGYMDELLRPLSSAAGAGGTEIIRHIYEQPANQIQIRTDLDRKIADFIALGEGHFRIADDVRHYVNPLALLIHLNTINKFFTQHPHIKAKFIELNGKDFSIEMIDGAIMPDWQSEAIAGGLPAAGYLHMVDRSSLAFYVEYYGGKSAEELFKDMAKSSSTGNSSTPMNNVYNLIDSPIAHELGHLFEVLIHTATFKEVNPLGFERAKQHLNAVRNLIELKRLENGHPDMSPTEHNNRLKKMGELTHTKEETEQSYELFVSCIKIGAKILKMQLISDTGIKFVSKYGEDNDQDWFAEAFAHAISTDKPNALDIMILKLIDFKEREFATEATE